MKSYTIKSNDENQRLDKFLQKAIPKLTQTLLYKYIRIKRIKVNGKKSEISYRLALGDLVECYINDEFFEESGKKDFLVVSPHIDIVYEDDNIILVNKKVGLVVHEDNENSVDTLINRVLHYLYVNGKYDPDEESSFIPALCNRIDRNTSGIVIVAKNAPTLRFMNQLIKERAIKKFYLCVLAGNDLKPADTLTHYHYKDEVKNQVYVYGTPQRNTKTMITKYRVLTKTANASLVEVELITGRTHQIRAHFAHIGYPIIGDGKYGNGEINKKYGLIHQALCSYKLIFDFEKSEATAPFDYLLGQRFMIDNVWFDNDFKVKFK